MSSPSPSSEVKNSTTDIDNNIQDETKSSPAPTPTRKRMSRAEKARLESEELLKSLGVSIDSGRQTRSSRRGASSSRVESPKPEPTPKRKATSNPTPRRGKKAKVEDQPEENDQTDHGTNHVEAKRQSVEKQGVPVEKSNASEEVDQSPPEKGTNTVQQMEVDDDTPQSIESNQKSVDAAASPSPSPVPPPSASQSQPEPAQPPTAISSQEDEKQPANEAIVIDSQPESVAAAEAVSVSAAAADTTTTAIVIDNGSPSVDESCEAAAQSQTERDEPIELASSPSSDVDQQTPQVTNSQTIISQSDTIVDLDTSSNEADDIKEVSASTDDVCSKTQKQEQQQPQKLDSLDLELINSDSSSHSENEVQIADIPPTPPQAASVQPTSTVQSDVVEIIDSAPSANVADSADQTNNTNAAANSVCANESSQDSVESSNQQKPIEIPENICTITVNTPVDETITTTTSETLLSQSNLTTA